MITSSSLKEEGFVGSEFLSVTPHKSCWPVNKNVVEAGASEWLPRRPSREGDWPGSYHKENTGEDVGTEVTVRLLRSPLRDCAQLFK